MSFSHGTNMDFILTVKFSNIICEKNRSSLPIYICVNVKVESVVDHLST